MTSLKELSLKLKSGEYIVPGDLSKYRLELSGWIGTIGEEMKEIQKDKPFKWAEMRKQVKTNREADNMWDASPQGQREIELRWDIKICDKISSSIRIRLETIFKEAQNQF